MDIISNVVTGITAMRYTYKFITYLFTPSEIKSNVVINCDDIIDLDKDDELCPPINDDDYKEIRFGKLVKV